MYVTWKQILNKAVVTYSTVQSKYSPKKSVEKPCEMWGKIAHNPNYISNGHHTNTSLKH